MTSGLERFADQIPPVADRTLLELVNGLTVARGITMDRAAQGVFARLIGRLAGRDRTGQLMTLQALVDGQQALTQWVAETAAHGTVTNLALARVATHLRHTNVTVTQMDTKVTDLSNVVARLAEICDERLTELERWRLDVDLRMAADRAMDVALQGWRAGTTYREVPWPYQVVLIGKELASGPCGRWEFQTGDQEYRARITDHLVGHLKIMGVPTGGFALATVLDHSWQTLPTPDHRLLLAETLGIGLDPVLRLPSTPLFGVAALTMELAALPDGARPGQPAQTALELVRRREGWIDGGATLTGFVRRAVHENMDAAVVAWQRIEGNQP